MGLPLTHLVREDGKTEDVKAKAGQVLYFPALDHLPENLSDKPFEVIGIELKA